MDPSFPSEKVKLLLRPGRWSLTGEARACTPKCHGSLPFSHEFRHAGVVFLPRRTKKGFPFEPGTQRYQKPTEEGGGYGGVISVMASSGTYSGAMRVALIVPILTN